MTAVAPVRLDRLLESVEPVELRGDPTTVEVSAIAHDTRQPVRGALFCCLRGRAADGHDLAPDAVDRGAVALLVERPLDVGSVQVVVDDARSAMAQAAASLFGHPSRAIDVIGVTGTNGKTTVTHFLHAILEAAGRRPAMIGNLTHDPDDLGPPNTPEAPALQSILRSHHEQGRDAVVVEVTSLALVKHRVDAIWFRAAVFTNLTQDHLNEHGSMEAYFEAKAILFEEGRTALGVVNRDDAAGRTLLERLGGRGVAYGLDDATDIVEEAGGSSFRWRSHPMRIHLEGRFNVANAVAAATTAAALGASIDAIAAGLEAVGAVRGRMEPVRAGQPFEVRIDYAHTPDALEHVIGAARSMAGGARVHLVFGCGGDRDRAKRPMMGQIATSGADRAYLTNDNPRREDPLAIIEEVRAGVSEPGRLVVEPDRRTAIRLAVSHARPGDVVVIAGKGHEQGQEVDGVTTPFDDRAEAIAALGELGWGSGS